MSQKALIFAGPKLQKALKDLSAGVKAIDLTPEAEPSKRQSILTRMENGTRSQSYNGYFTLKDVSTYNGDGTVKEYRVAVCDGETWDPEKQESGDSIAILGNNVTLAFKSKIISIPSDYSEYHIYLKCGYNERYRNEIILSPFSPTRLPGYSYYLVGDIEKPPYSNVMTIRQRHGFMLMSFSDLKTNSTSNGIPFIPYTSYSGSLSLRCKENEDGTFDASTVHVCDGATWDPIACSSDESTFYVNGTLHKVPCISIPAEGGTLVLVYDYISGNTTLRYGGNEVEPGDIKGFVRIGFISLPGTTDWRNIVPPNGEYHMWLFAPGDCSGIVPKV